MEERSLLAQIPDQRLPPTASSGVSAPVGWSDSHAAVCFRFTKYRADTASDAGRVLVFALTAPTRSFIAPEMGAGPKAARKKKGLKGALKIPSVLESGKGSSEDIHKY